MTQIPAPSLTDSDRAALISRTVSAKCAVSRSLGRGSPTGKSRTMPAGLAPGRTAWAARDTALPKCGGKKPRFVKVVRHEQHRRPRLVPQPQQFVLKCLPGDRVKG